MLRIKKILLTFAAVSLLAAPLSAQAAEDKSMGLYVNLATKDTVKAGHAFAHAIKLNERGHPIAFFLNGDAVLIAIKNVPQTSFQDKSLQVWLQEAMAKGAKVIVCSVCLGLHNVTPGDLIEGAVVGSPEVVSEYLFDPAYQVISW